MTAQTAPRTLLAAAALALACSTGDESTAASATAGTGLTTTDATSTTDDATTDDATTEGGTTSTSTSTSTTATTTTTTTTGETTTTTSAGCPEGSEGCPCDSGRCDGELSCIAGTCVAPLDCPGADKEPNNSEAEAQDLGMITDDDDDGTSISGTLAGKGDVDWFTFVGSDTAFHTTEPTRTLTTDMGLRFCKFIECVEGGPAVTEINCPAGADFAISPQLRPGCCSGEGFELSDYNCPGSDDSLRIYFRLDRALFDECIDYTIDYFL